MIFIKTIEYITLPTDSNPTERYNGHYMYCKLIR